jgi:hypothetical protein
MIKKYFGEKLAFLFKILSAYAKMDNNIGFQGKHRFGLCTREKRGTKPHSCNE